MSVAIRYQSRGGHVKEMAEIIAEGAKVEPGQMLTAER